MENMYYGNYTFALYFIPYNTLYTINLTRQHVSNMLYKDSRLTENRRLIFEITTYAK